MLIRQQSYYLLGACCCIFKHIGTSARSVVGQQDKATDWLWRGLQDTEEDDAVDNLDVDLKSDDAKVEPVKNNEDEDFVLRGWIFVGVFIGVLFIGLLIFWLVSQRQTMKISHRQTIKRGKGLELQMLPIVTVDNKSSPNKIFSMPH